MRSETWGVENTTICTICKQTLNLKVQKDIISYRERAGTLPAQAYSVKREGETNIVKILGPSSDDLLRMRKAENETQGGGEMEMRLCCQWMTMFEYYVPRSRLCRSPGLPNWQRNHLGQWPPWLKPLSFTQEFTKIKALDYLPSKNITFPQEQTQTKSPKHNPSFATRIHLYNQMC